jgi:isoprenylcysteine carboxyl methyltransferase (ICMT) family protein YpbQ
MKHKSLYIWLLMLAVPVSVLIAAQVDTSSAPSIGGGGYDLGPFVYSWLLIIFTALWSLCAFVAALLKKDRASSFRAFGLAGFGVLVFTVMMLFYGENLS